MFVSTFRKYSRPHEGIVYLIAPSEWTRDPWVTVLSPREGEKRGDTIFYTAADHSSNCSSTVSGSSSGGLVALVNYDSPLGSDLMKSGYETSEEDEDDEGEVSFSAPTSPNLIRHTKVMSLQERSRLLSHSSLEDLSSLNTTSPIRDQEHEQLLDATRKAYKRRTSLGFLILESPSSGAEANDEAEEDEDEDEIVDISKVLSTSRLNSINFHHYATSEELPPMRLRVPSPPVLLLRQERNDDSTAMNDKRERNKKSPNREEERSEKRSPNKGERSPNKGERSGEGSPRIKGERPLSEIQLPSAQEDTAVGKDTLPANLSSLTNNTPVTNNNTAIDDSNDSQSSRQGSRWKRLFQKSSNKLPSQNSLASNDGDTISTSSNNTTVTSGGMKLTAIGILKKGFKTSRNPSSASISSSNDQQTGVEYSSSVISTDDGDTVSSSDNSYGRQLLNDAMKSSRTKFIII